mgnify:CR=1 FL=1|tara:strand:+ start:365 stop:931 length:567 start_codon:yes stop_codon:yes gene_type:complete
MNIKKEIKNKHKGRGNSWLKIPNNTQTYKDIISLISPIENSNKILSCYERESYAWIRFSKVSKNNMGIYEVRYLGSKLDHPDCTIELSHDLINAFELLGNTPVKLQIEIDPKDRVVKNKDPLLKTNIKTKKSLSSLKTSKDNNDISDDINSLRSKIKNLQYVKPEKSTEKELSEWINWCKLNGIYNEE